jgi:hypothetical protein
MTDVEDPYAIREDPIKELVGIANEGNDTHAEPLLDARRGASGYSAICMIISRIRASTAAAT